LVSLLSLRTRVSATNGREAGSKVKGSLSQRRRDGREVKVESAADEELSG